MTKFILLLSVLALVSGIIGFSFDFAASSFLRILCLITADIAVILLLGKYLFFTEKGKQLRQRVRVR
ncbi:hypothetical protein [Nonlabens marinus]|uniref:DUF1328 domain-containing protein n=1 Tax=Nonlabens marinus S1-08 TaxID=1454201 RepID=W8VXW5_9FLAO|nr:hypothetical protein [Nonlabens marinus]BAO56637.1 hypothetical protein NMS_2628 [Nonlabens marinus S1-08]